MRKGPKTMLAVAAVLMLSLCSVAQASADTVTLKTGNEEPAANGAAIEFQGGKTLFTYSSGSFECREFSLMTQLGANQSDPLTMDVLSGVLQGDHYHYDPQGPCIIAPAGTEVFFSGISSTEDLTLSPDGSGELPIEMVETRIVWGQELHCTRTGTIPLSWDDNAGEFTGADVFPGSALLDGSGACGGATIQLDASPFELFDEEGEPVELVIE